MRRALAPAALLVLLLTCAAGAHFPMTFPTAPRVEPGTEVTVDLALGHPYMNDRFEVGAPDLVRLRFPLGAIADLTSKVTTHTDPASIAGAGTGFPFYRVSFTPRREGDHVLSIHTRTSEPPQRNVSDYVKVVIHVGTAQMGWWEPLGDPLEIVPLTRPYAIRRGDAFRGQVLEEGRPMVGGVIEAETYTDARKDPAPELADYRRAERTDPSGCFAVTLDRVGWWLLSCATDGGPGEQGSSAREVKRAVMWVYVDPAAPGPAAHE